MGSDRVDSFLGQMRQGGLRITASRRIITEQLLATDDHVTGPALAEKVNEVAPEIDQSCTECGSVTEVHHSEFVSMASEVARRYRFEMRPAHFAVDGKCAACTDPTH